MSEEDSGTKRLDEDLDKLKASVETITVLTGLFSAEAWMGEIMAESNSANPDFREFIKGLPEQVQDAILSLAKYCYSQGGQDTIKLVGESMAKMGVGGVVAIPHGLGDGSMVQQLGKKGQA